MLRLQSVEKTISPTCMTNGGRFFTALVQTEVSVISTIICLDKKDPKLISRNNIQDSLFPSCPHFTLFFDKSYLGHNWHLLKLLHLLNMHRNDLWKLIGRNTGATKFEYIEILVNETYWTGNTSLLIFESVGVESTSSSNLGQVSTSWNREAGRTGSRLRAN